MIDRYQLRYVLAVVDHGNFSKAAAACNVSQPTLSIGIAKLEKAIGATLFHRTNRRVQLTEAGVEFVAHARRIEEGFALAERAVAGAGSPGRLRVGILVTTPAAFTHAFVRDPHLAADRQRVEIVEGRPRELAEGLQRGRIDVAFGIVRDEVKLQQEPLFTEGYSLTVSSRHPLAGQGAVAAGALAGEPMIVRRRCELLAETTRHFTMRGVRPFFAARTTCDERALHYVHSGLGITVMPDGFAMPGVARVAIEDFLHTRDLGLIYAPHVDDDAVRHTPTVTALVAAAARMASGTLA